MFCIASKVGQLWDAFYYERFICVVDVQADDTPAIQSLLNADTKQIRLEKEVGL